MREQATESREEKNRQQEDFLCHFCSPSLQRGMNAEQSSSLKSRSECRKQEAEYLSNDNCFDNRRRKTYNRYFQLINYISLEWIIKIFLRFSYHVYANRKRSPSTFFLRSWTQEGWYSWHVRSIMGSNTLHDPNCERKKGGVACTRDTRSSTTIFPHSA